MLWSSTSSSNLYGDIYKELFMLRHYDLTSSIDVFCLLFIPLSKHIFVMQEGNFYFELLVWMPVLVILPPPPDGGSFLL